MKKAWLLLLLFFGFSLFASQVEILEKRIDIHVLEDGRVVEHVYKKIKINGFTGMRRAGEWFYTYNPDLTEVKILKSVTHNSEGKVIPSPSNAILDFSPGAIENAPDFSSIREKIVSHTGLEPNCLVEFEYEIRDKVPHRLIFFKDLRESFPIKKLELTLVDNRHCGLYTNHLSLKEGNVFVARNIKAFATNDTGKEYLLNTPCIAVVIKDPGDYFKNYLKSLSGKDLKEVTALMGVDNLEGKRLIYAVFDFLNNRLNTVNLEASVYGYKCRDFKEIVSSGYATGLEKSVLAYWVLKNKGLDPEFLLSAFVVNKSLYAVEDFGVAVNSIKWPYKRENLPYYNLNLKQVLTPELKAYLTVKAEEEEDGFKGKFYFEGNDKIAFAISGLSSKSDKELEKFNGYVVKEGKVEGKIKNKIVFSDWIENSLPAGYSDFVFYNFAEIPYRVDISESYVLTFKKPINAVFHSKRVVNKAGVCEVKYTVKGNTLKVSRTIKLNPGYYTGKAMQDLQRLLLPVTSESYSTVIFE